MLVLQIYGHVCRVCLGKTSNLVSLNETNEEYSLTMLDLLHQSIPGLEAGTGFPVPQEICVKCRDQLLTAYRFQQMCMTTNEEMYKMWQESQKTEEAMMRRQQQQEEDTEQEIKLIDDVETCKDLDPIKLEYNAGQKKTGGKSEDYTTPQSDIVVEGESHEPINDSQRMFMCTLCLKRCRTKDMLEQHNTNCRTVYLDENEVGKEDDEDDIPLISLRNKNNPVIVKFSTKNGLVNPDDNHGYDKDSAKHISNTTNHHCHNCNKSFKYIHHLSKHQCKLITKQLHPCQMCAKQFSSAKLVQKHIRSKHKDVFLPLIKKLKLPENIPHNVEDSLEIDSANVAECEMDNCHEENSIDFRKSDCSISDNIEDEEETRDICTKNSQSSATSKSSQSSKRYACTDCNAYFSFEKQLERHLKKHTDAHRFVCLVCSDRFKYPFMLQKHVEKHHPEGISNRKVAEVKKASQEKSHVCNYCSAAYTNIGGLAQHMSKKHPEIVPFKCDKCDKTFVVEEHLKIHSNRHMGIKNFKCDLCDKSFSFKFAMKQHMRIHTGDLNYLCTLCGKKFYRPSNLRQHMQRHGDDKPYTCPHCPKRFKCPSDRYIHLMSHQEGKNHVCSTCGARFSRVDTLHQHQVLHTGEKPYKCDQCPMAFPRLMNLNRHLRTHTGEKPYKCKYCDKAYAQSNDLNKHLRTHVGENTYMCSQCPSAFKYQADLRNHEWEHYRMQKQEEADGNRGKDEIKTNNIEMQEHSVREENK